MDDEEAVQLLESLWHAHGDDDGEEDLSQRPVADVDTPPEGGGEDSGLTTTTTSFEAESREAREDLEAGYSTLQLLQGLLDDGKATIKSHFRRSTDTEVPPLPHRPKGQGRGRDGKCADGLTLTGHPHRPTAPPPMPTVPPPTPHRERTSASIGARRSWRTMYASSRRRAAFPMNGIDAALSRAR